MEDDFNFDFDKFSKEREERLNCYRPVVKDNSTDFIQVIKYLSITGPEDSVVEVYFHTNGMVSAGYLWGGSPDILFINKDGLIVYDDECRKNKTHPDAEFRQLYEYNNTIKEIYENKTIIKIDLKEFLKYAFSIGCKVEMTEHGLYVPV